MHETERVVPMIVRKDEHHIPPSAGLREKIACGNCGRCGLEKGTPGKGHDPADSIAGRSAMLLETDD
jgi:hypothetical protein